MPGDGVLFTSTLWMDSGLPEDYAVNTWHLQCDAGDEVPAATAFQGWLTTFFLAIDEYFSAELEGTVAYRAYKLSDAKPRVPFLIDGAALTPGTTRLPSEVALCMSFQGSRISGAPQARRRGRVYLGPLAVVAADTATGRPAGAFRTAVQAAGDALVTSSKASSVCRWSVYSPTNALPGSGHDPMVPVDNGWVDNAFDTQRRRGVAPTSRLTFS